MLVQSRQRVLKALLGSAMFLSLPLATGCQSANFGGNMPGFGWVSGWWATPDAANDPSKPPAGFEMPSSKADPNGSAYAGGASRTPSGGYSRENAAPGAGGYAREGYGNQGGSYAAGDRSNPNNWGGANRSGGGYSAAARGEEEYAAAPSKGYGAAERGDRAARGGYDPYGDSAPSTGGSAYGASAQGAGYAAAARGGEGYSARMASSNQRATRSSGMSEEEGVVADEGDAYSSEPAGSRFSSSGGYGAAAPRGGRTSKVTDDEGGMMTADDELETSYPRTSGYGSGYRVPSARGASASSTERRYPSSRSSAPEEGGYDDDYGMTDDAEPAVEEPAVQKVAAVEEGRYGLSAKAADMLDRSGDGEFRPGSTSRPGMGRTASVSRAGYSSEEETAPAESTASRYSSRYAE